MKRQIIVSCLMLLAATTVIGQPERRAFDTYLYNKELKVFMRINLYDNDINVPGQEVYGPLPGYLSADNTSFCWLITSAQLTDSTTARLSLINDYGSEDLTARLKQTSDSTYEFRHLDGSPVKMPENRKWKKLPKTFILKAERKK